MDWFDVAIARFLGYPNPTRKHAEPINCSFDLSSWISGRKDNYPPNWLILQGTPLSFRGMQYDMHTLQYYIYYVWSFAAPLQSTNKHNKKLQHATNEWTRIVLLQFAHLSFVVFHVQKGQTSNKSMRIIENRFGSARLAIFVGGLWHKMICCCLRCLPQTLGYLLYIYTLIPSQGDEG